eukprot:4830530-Pyramimonas_sp.AAC.1
MLIPHKREHAIEKFHLVLPFHDADGWCDGLKGRASAREWVLAGVRPARSPRITAEYCRRVAIEYLVTRRLHTLSSANLS